MAFQGTVLSVGELLAYAAERRERDTVARPDSDVLRHTAASNAEDCARLIASGEPPTECWRFGILQTFDDYRSEVRRGTPELAAAVFADAPPATGSAEIDAAFAALADHLAESDGWTPPAWVHDPSRVTTEWFPSVPWFDREEALQESPRAFRERGIFITPRSLARA